MRKATEADRRSVFEWLVHSDVTPSVMGPPHFPDHPVPSWEEFCADYRPHYFDDAHPEDGRCFIIVNDGVDIGVASYNALRTDGSTDVDIWLRSEADCGQGLGSDALRTLTDYLHREFGVSRVVIAPSARNRRAIAAYEKAGFERVPEETWPQFVRPEEMGYEDNVVLVKQYA